MQASVPEYRYRCKVNQSANKFTDGGILDYVGEFLLHTIHMIDVCKNCWLLS